MVSLAESQRFQLLGVSSLMSSVCRRLLAIIVSVVCPYLSVRKCIAIFLWPFWRFDVLAFSRWAVGVWLLALGFWRCVFAVCLPGILFHNGISARDVWIT